jgi:hypothetical protein
MFVEWKGIGGGTKAERRGTRMRVGWLLAGKEGRAEGLHRREEQVKIEEGQKILRMEMVGDGRENGREV